MSLYENPDVGRPLSATEYDRAVADDLNGDGVMRGSLGRPLRRAPTCKVCGSCLFRGRCFSCELAAAIDRTNGRLEAERAASGLPDWVWEQ